MRKEDLNEQAERIRVCIVVDHDVMLRHFILSECLKPLHELFDVHYLFPKYKNIRFNVDELDLPNTHRIIASPRERRKKLRALEQMAYHRSIQRFPEEFADGFRALWRRIVGEEAYALLVKRCKWYRYHLSRWHLLHRAGRNRDLGKFLSNLNPDVIIYPTVLDGLYPIDLLREGRRLKIPTVYLMNSWDNPSTRAAVVGFPDQLVVWGEQTRRHAIDYMGAKPERVSVLGAAQFEVFRNAPAVPRAQYRRQLGIRADETVIAYGGCSRLVNETAHLALLDQAIEDGTLPRLKILYRPHPWRAFPEQETYFYDIDWKNVIMDPTMEECYRAIRNGRSMPIELANYKNTHIFLHAIDGLISPLSTILLETIMHGKPIMCLFPEEEMNLNKGNSLSSSDLYFPHVAEFFERVDCNICRRYSDLITEVQELLQSIADPSMSEKLQTQSEYFVRPSSDAYHQRLALLIDKLVAGRSRKA